MNKRIVARVGSYTNSAGEEKKEYQNLGVILTNDNGEYGLLDPCINLAGVLLKQNILAAKEGKPQRDKVAFSIYSDQPKNENSYNRGPEYNQQQQPAPQQQQQPYQQQPAPPQYQQPQQGYEQPI